MANKQIIILDDVHASPLDTPNNRQFRVAYWIPVPVARQTFYVTTVVSAWSGASGAENTAIQAGQVLEIVRSESFDSGSGAPTLAQIKAALIANWTALNTAIQNNNHWANYGSFYDGSVWTAGGVS